jgi:hypothetical protein
MTEALNTAYALTKKQKRVHVSVANDVNLRRDSAIEICGLAVSPH